MVLHIHKVIVEIGLVNAAIVDESVHILVGLVTISIPLTLFDRIQVEATHDFFGKNIKN